jgi:cell division protein FtsB
MANLQRIADAPLLKLLQYLVSGVMLPAAVWMGTGLLARMDRIETLLMSTDKNYALLKQDVDNLKSLVPQRQAEMNKLTEQIVDLRLEITLLKGGRR